MYLFIRGVEIAKVIYSRYAISYNRCVNAACCARIYPNTQVKDHKNYSARRFYHDFIGKIIAFPLSLRPNGAQHICILVIWLLLYDYRKHARVVWFSLFSSLFRSFFFAFYEK